MLRDWTCYVRERLLIPKIILLCVLFSVACWFVVDRASPDFFIAAVVIATLCVVAFRLMDDLADRIHDSTLHPGRCLVRTRHIGSFRVLAMCLVSALIILTALWLTPGRALGMFVLAGALFALGLAYGSFTVHRRIIVAAVLLKYPAVILLMASEPERVSSVVLAAVFYIVPFADEVMA